MVVVVGAVFACAAAGTAIVAGQGGPSSPQTVAPSDTTNARLIAEKDGVRFYLSEGVGPTEGMICFSRATATVTHTGCDPPEALAARGIVLSEDVSGSLALDAYLPEGYDRVEVGSTILPVADRILSTTLPKATPSIRARGGGQELVIPVPGAAR